MVRAGKVSPYPLSELKRGHPVGGFEILEVYPEGRGGMARVVRAGRKGKADTEVALKISRGGPNRDYFAAAIQKEVEVLQKLEHRGVVRLSPVSDGKNRFKERAIEIIDSPWYFGMEVLAGGSLETYVRGLGPLSLGEAAAICHQVGEALDHIHGRGFAHNDIKPDNVLFRRPLVVGDRLEPVLIDFGVAAKLVKQQVDGSVVYMAPERLQEGRDPGPPEARGEETGAKGDVWSLGILFYRMLVGREPFMGLSDRSITSAIQRATPEAIATKRQDIPKEVDEFVLEGCLAKDPRLRVSTEQFNSFIERFSGDWRVRRAPKAKRRLPWQR